MQRFKTERTDSKQTPLDAIRHAQRFMRKHADYFRHMDPIGFRQLHNVLHAALVEPETEEVEESE